MDDDVIPSNQHQDFDFLLQYFMRLTMLKTLRDWVRKSINNNTSNKLFNEVGDMLMTILFMKRKLKSISRWLISEDKQENISEN